MYRILVNISRPTIFTGSSSLTVFEEIEKLIKLEPENTDIEVAHQNTLEEPLTISFRESKNIEMKSDRDFAINVYSIWGK